MTEPFVRRVHVDEVFHDRGERYALTALIAETVAVYYWSEAFMERGRGPKKFSVLGQRGLSAYAAKKIAQILRTIEQTAAKKNETLGWQYGVTVSLRKALLDRRNTEHAAPEYADQMSVSIYRSRKELTRTYRIGTSDARATFDIAGYNRGKEYPWDLSQLLNPVAVLNKYGRV